MQLYASIHVLQLLLHAEERKTHFPQVLYFKSHVRTRKIVFLLVVQNKIHKTKNTVISSGNHAAFPISFRGLTLPRAQPQKAYSHWLNTTQYDKKLGAFRKCYTIRDDTTRYDTYEIGKTSNFQQ